MPEGFTGQEVPLRRYKHPMTMTHAPPTKRRCRWLEPPAVPLDFAVHEVRLQDVGGVFLPAKMQTC